MRDIYDCVKEKKYYYIYTLTNALKYLKSIFSPLEREECIGDVEVEAENNNVEKLTQHEFGKVDVVVSLDINEVSDKFIHHLLLTLLI